MIHQCFSVKDLKAESFALPFFLPRIEVAVRTFCDALKDSSHPMHAHPDDYQLFVLGTFNDETGLFESLAQPRFLMSGQGEVS